MEEGKPPKDLRKAVFRLLWLSIGTITSGTIAVLLSLASGFNILIITLPEWLLEVFVRAGGVIAGVLFSLFFILLSIFLSRLSAATKALSEKVASKARFLANTLTHYVDTFSISLHAFSESLLKSLGSRTAEVLMSGAEVVMSASVYLSKILLYVGGSFNRLCSITQEGLVAFNNKLKAPKWYHQKDAIDPGLIEVSLAVTAVLIALPSLVSPDTPSTQIIAIQWFRFFSEAVPTLTSVNLLNIYAKSRGAKSMHILLSPIEDGPFFLLGWAIVIGFVIIAIIAFPVS